MLENSMFQDDELLMISGLQHFKFCKRQWGLIHIEQQWAENGFTTDGILFHETAHDSSKREKRGSVIIVRGLNIASKEMGVSGCCDVVEFHQDPEGIDLFGYDGKWKPVPIEYKSGKPKEHMADETQLCCEAMCLEHSLACRIDKGYLFYGKTHRRVEVIFGQDLRNEVLTCLKEMHTYMKAGYTPKAHLSKACKACSLFELCLPALANNASVEDYLDEVLKTNA